MFYQMRGLQIFSPDQGLTKVNTDKVHLSIFFFFIYHALGIMAKKILSNQDFKYFHTCFLLEVLCL